MSEETVCYGLDEENFLYEDLDEILARLEDDDRLLPGAIIYVGDAIRKAPSDYFDVSDIFEQMGERAYDDAGEHTDSFPDVSIDERAELAMLVRKWLDKNIKVSFWSVESTHSLTITAEMIVEFKDKS